MRGFEIYGDDLPFVAALLSIEMTGLEVIQHAKCGERPRHPPMMEIHASSGCQVVEECELRTLELDLGAEELANGTGNPFSQGGLETHGSAEVVSGRNLVWDMLVHT